MLGQDQPRDSHVHGAPDLPAQSTGHLSSKREWLRQQYRNELLASERRHELEYRSRYIFGGAMNTADLLKRARHEARLTQSELATRARTSRPTLSAYEHGRTSPTLETAARLLAAAGQELTAVPQVKFVERVLSRGRTALVPTSLPRLTPRQALATITLPLHLNWSQPNREFRLAERDRRALVYEIVLREGTPQDVLAYIDGALLVDLWNSLVLPRDVRAAWSEVVDSALQQAPQ
jgi:transcriptional regulator with XRE-family HTH domain